MLKKTRQRVRFRTVMGAFLLLAAVQIGLNLRGNWASAASAEANPIGSVPNIALRTWPDNVQTQLTDIEPGSCRYIVVYASSCGFARGAASDFRRIALRQGAELPSDWRIVWISLNELSASDVPAQPDFPWPVYTAEDPITARNSVGARGLPSHLILDRSGRVLAAAPGVTLWKPDVYRDDCTVESQ